MPTGSGRFPSGWSACGSLSDQGVVMNADDDEDRSRSWVPGGASDAGRLAASNMADYMVPVNAGNPRSTCTGSTVPTRHQ